VGFQGNKLFTTRFPLKSLLAKTWNFKIQQNSFDREGAGIIQFFINAVLIKPLEIDGKDN
jgi:hypothetical protein